MPAGNALIYPDRIHETQLRRLEMHSEAAHLYKANDLKGFQQSLLYLVVPRPLRQEPLAAIQRLPQPAARLRPTSCTSSAGEYSIIHNWYEGFIKSFRELIVDPWMQALPVTMPQYRS